MRHLYSLAFYLLLPLILAYFLWRSRREPGYRQRWAERFGAGRRASPGGIWLHAASVGEVQAARTLVESLLQQYPQLPVTISCVTPTGSQRILELWAGRVGHRYLPFDTPAAVQRFLDEVQPRLALVLETEIWPNLYRACASRKIPLLILSARLSERSLARLRRFPGAALLRETLAGVSAILAQTQADAERYRRAGATEQQVCIAGNLKFDHALDPAANARAQVLRERWGLARPVWIAASTHEGEEAIVLAAHARLREQLQDLYLILVPRHPQRFEAVAALCTSAGFATARRSLGDTGSPGHAVLLVDSIGELNQFYAAADIAFVGGSLVPIGGHNLLEPAALGLPILVGPHMHGQQEISQLLQSAGAARQVDSTEAMVAAISEYLGSTALRHQAAAAAQAVIEQNRGALARVMRELASHLPQAVVA